MKTLALGLVLASLATAASAQTDLAVEASDKWRAADKRLNAFYKELLVFMQRQDASRAETLRKGFAKPDGDPGYVAQLRISQRAWLAYRDEHCKLVSFEFRGGSAQRMSAPLCLADRTEARIAELRTLQESMMPK